jgi:hypothetical protein
VVRCRGDKLGQECWVVYFHTLLLMLCWGASKRCVVGAWFA